MVSVTPSLSKAALRSLEALGVEVRLGARVTRCDACGVMLDPERIEARTIIWAAGVMVELELLTMRGDGGEHGLGRFLARLQGRGRDHATRHHA